MQLKQFYNIAAKVSSRKSATTFGDLPDGCNENKLNSREGCGTYIWGKVGVH